MVLLLVGPSLLGLLIHEAVTKTSKVPLTTGWWVTGSVKSWKLKLNVPSELIAEAERVKVIGGVPAGPSVQVSVTVIEVPLTVVPVNRGLVSLVTGTPPTVFTFGHAPGSAPAAGSSAAA